MSSEPRSTSFNFPWLLRMAWRDSRKSRGRLILFTTSIVLGIAALTAISSFGDNLSGDIENEAAELLGADLVLRTNATPDSARQAFLDSLDGTKALEAAFNSMAYFPKTGGGRFVELRALQGDFPFYGQFQTQPTAAALDFRKGGPKVLVENALLIQFGVDVGDSVRLGKQKFEIVGNLLQAPGRSGLAATVAPVVYLPMDYLDETGLVRFGSRVRYKNYFLFEEGRDVESMVDDLRSPLRTHNLRAETIEDRKRSIGTAFENLTNFLNLVGFIALLLGCLGVASAVQIYIREKITTVAILRCLGASGRQSFTIYLIQILVMGFIGSVLGVMLGSLIQQVLPVILKEFLPFTASSGFSILSAIRGLLTGMAVSVLFALLPLLAIRKISPLNTLRASFESEMAGRRDGLTWLVYGLIIAFILGFAYLQVPTLKEAAFFTGAVLVGFLLLAAVARGVMWAVRKYFPTNWSYLWRQGLANLYRPNNQTLILIVSIGLGTAMITTLFFVQGLLLQQIDLSGREDAPNILLFDIQSHEREEVAQFTRDYPLPVMQEIPVLTMRVKKLKDVTRQAFLQDSTPIHPRWVFNYEFRASFREELLDSEEVIAGEWKGKIDDGEGLIPISLEEGLAKRNFKVEVGDTVIFDVQGTDLPVVVGSLRKMTFDQMNFQIVFPAGKVERFPQIHMLTTKADSTIQSAQYQRAIIQLFPTLSIIDLGLILNTLDEILNKVAFVIQFMALFSIITGILVLIGSIYVSKFQRVQESVLLRTLGASRRQILWINAIEYFLLGLLASLTGIIIALLCSWALAYFSFETQFVPKIWPLLTVVATVTLMTMILGMLNIRSILGRPPLEVLRREG